MLPKSEMPMRCKVLCVDDDHHLTDLLRYALTRAGYAVQEANTGAEALRLATVDPPDVVLLDIRLPDIDGRTLCTQLRAMLHVPIVMLTAHKADADVLSGFQHGADDYITKPFSMQILLYRLKAALRRSPRDPTAGEQSEDTYQVGGGVYNPKQNDIQGPGGRVKLTHTEGKLLYLLVRHPGRVLSVEHIMEQLWGYDTDCNLSVIKTHVHCLRAKVAAAVGDRTVIYTVPGNGYSLRQGSTARAHRPVTPSGRPGPFSYRDTPPTPWIDAPSA